MDDGSGRLMRIVGAAYRCGRGPAFRERCSTVFGANCPITNLWALFVIGTLDAGCCVPRRSSGERVPLAVAPVCVPQRMADLVDSGSGAYGQSTRNCGRCRSRAGRVAVCLIAGSELDVKWERATCCSRPTTFRELLVSECYL